MVNAWKMGMGSGSILFGIYLFFIQNNLVELIFGVILIAFGIGLIASDK